MLTGFSVLFLGQQQTADAPVCVSYLCLIARLLGEFKLVLKRLKCRLIVTLLFVSAATQKQRLRCFRAIAPRLIESQCLFVILQAAIRFAALNVQARQRQTRPRLVLTAAIPLRGFESLLEILLGFSVVAASQVDIANLNRAARNQALHLIGLSQFGRVMSILLRLIGLAFFD